MKLASMCVLSVLLAATLHAQLNPGVVVTSGEPFPIVADVNGDGLDDLVQEERTMVINNGTTLSDVRNLPIPSPEHVQGVLDVNGDHIPDILTVNRGLASQPVWKLYIADASGHYTSQPIVISTGATPYIADVDGDGKDDFLVMTPVRPDGFRTIGMNVQVLRSRGDGTFDAMTPFRVPPDPQINANNNRLLTTDLNHDGLPDIVMRSPEDLVVLRGAGGGHFNVESRYVPEDVAYGWWDTQLADVDGDGNVDVVEPGFHQIRVFYGDGHGNFPRMTTTPIAKVHDAVIPPGLPDLHTIDTSNQPRDLAIGHFTQGDRTQIAAGTGEGDLVVFSYDNGTLHEVGRTRTEFLSLDVRSGHFRNAAADDIYVMGTYIWGDQMPKPRLFGADALGTAAPERLLPALHHRAASSPRSATTTFKVSITGDCIPGTSGTYAFVRDGVFGVAQTADTKLEGVFDGPAVYLRATVPYLSLPITAKLTQSGSSYVGMANIVGSCGGLYGAMITLTPIP